MHYFPMSFIRQLVLDIAVIVPISCGLVMAGSLTPPGPVAPTMKPLDQIEPRTPISSVPFTISTGGSYYLTKNLTYAGVGDGITVNAGPTTIDLNGFTLDGGIGNGGSGIRASIAVQDLTVRDGFISHWGTGVLAISGNSGQAHLEGVSVLFCTGHGVSLWDATIRNCRFNYNLVAGAFFGGVASITYSRATGNGNTGMILNGPRGSIENCTIDSNGGWGVFLGQSGVIRQSIIADNAGLGIGILDRTVVADNNIYGNGQHGIQDIGSGNNHIEGNNVMNNGGYGIQLSAGRDTVIQNTAYGNLLGNFSISGLNNTAIIDTTGTSTNPWVNFSF